MAIQVSSTTVIDNSRNLTNIANATTSATANSFVLRGADGKICTASLSNVLNRGSLFQGGYLLCSFAGIHWIVAPTSTEVSRTWGSRGDANTVAQQVTGCTGWFVPTLSQLANPGFSYKVFWDTWSGTSYWSSTPGANGCNGEGLYMTSGSLTSVCVNCVRVARSFRCVTY